MATEFGKLAARRRIPFPPGVPSPSHGRPEGDVLADLREHFVARARRFVGAQRETVAEPAA